MTEPNLLPDQQVFVLRDYQREICEQAKEILEVSKFVYLAMEVRTGKTLCALQIAADSLCENVLFVTKKKAISSIESDYKMAGHKYNLTVTNYENLHNIKPEYDFYILDEAHTLGAFPKPSLRTKQLKTLCSGKPIIYLSGTPTPESYSQIYHQLYVSSFSPFAKAGYTNFYKWAKDFVELKHKFLYGRQINDYSKTSVSGQEHIDLLKALCFINYSQKEAGFAQEVEERILSVEMLPSTYATAKRLKKDRVIEGKNGVLLADTEVKLMNKLHQMFSGTIKLENGAAITIDRTKAQFINNRFYDRFKRIAIFYKFIEEGNLLREEFPINTSSPDVFNEQGAADIVFIGQIQSFREGVNLSGADYLIMYNIDYSAVSYWQARARMQSKDRVKPAILYWIFAKGSLDYMIHNAVNNKKNYTLSYFKKDLRNVGE